VTDTLQNPGPVSLADALDTLRISGLLSAGPPEIVEEARELEPPAWPDSFPNDVLDRTDAAGLTDFTWDVPRVRELVGRIAELARLPCSEIREVGSPHLLDDIPDSDPPGSVWERNSPLRDRWGRWFGTLTHPSWQEYGWREFEFDSPRDRSGLAPPPRTAPLRGLTLWATAEAEMEGPLVAPMEPIARCSVAHLLLGLVGFMSRHGARGDAPHWRPSEDVCREFGVELRIGRLLLEAFCAGLGYLCPVEGDIEISRRPVVRLQDRTLLSPARPRFHHDVGPAIEFADGSGEHFLSGIPFEGWMRQAIVDGVLSLRYVREFDDPFQRMAAYAVMPPRALLDGVDAELVDVGRKGTRLYRLRGLPDHSAPAWYMVMTDPSTGREYGEFVPPEVGRRGSADAAQAAAWDIEVEDYLRMTLEG
jgi:hypothetical protein